MSAAAAVGSTLSASVPGLPKRCAVIAIACSRTKGSNSMRPARVTGLAWMAMSGLPRKAWASAVAGWALALVSRVGVAAAIKRTRQVGMPPAAARASHAVSGSTTGAPCCLASALRSPAGNSTALETAQHVGKLLIEFTYDQIEGTRRRALSEMRRVALEHAGNEEKFRHALLAYLSTSAYSSMLQAVADAPSGGLELIPGILERIESPLDAADLASQAARLLGSIFDHPGLLVIHAAALVASPNPDANGAAQDVALAFESAIKFDLASAAILTALDAALDALEVSSNLRTNIALGLTAQAQGNERARSHAALLAHSQSPAMAEPGLSFLVTGLLTETDRLLETLKNAV